MLPSLETSRIIGIPIRTLVLLILGGVFVWNFSLRWNMLHQHRIELGGVESNVVYGIQKVLLGLDLYEDPEAPPFDVIQYPPAYTLLCVGVAKVAGLSGDDVRPLFLVSRSISLLFWLLTVALVYYACRLAGSAAWSAVMAAGITVCCIWEHAFSRMDSMVLATSAATVLCFIQWIRSGANWALMASALFAILGVFTKQSGIVVVAVPLLYLITSKQWRPLRTSLITTVIATMVGVSITLLLGTPLDIYKNTILGLRNGYSPMFYQVLFVPATYKYFIGWHLLALVVMLRGLRSTHAPIRFLAVAVPVSLAFGMITAGKYGSGMNYLHESLMLTFIGGAILISQLKNATWRNTTAWAFAIYGGLFAAYRTNSVEAWYQVGEPDAIHVQLMRDDMAVRDVLLNELDLRPEDRIFITYRGALEHFFVGQGLLTQKDIVRYSKDRLFDYTRFHTAMRDGEVRFVVTDDGTGPITYLDSTYTDWRPIRSVKGRTIMVHGDP